MLEETTPPYSYTGHLYVIKRTHVWHPPCRRSFRPSVAFSHPRKTLWGTSLSSEMKPIQRTSVANSYLPQEHKQAMRNIIRCPYCVEAGNFKAMIAPESGEGYICSRCGHVVLPSNPQFECVCNKCARFKIS